MTLDISEVSENELIADQLAGSIQEFPDARNGSNLPLYFDIDLFERKPLLSPLGTRQRIIDQHRWYHKEGNSMFQSVNSGLVKRVQSLPYLIESPEDDNSIWDNLLRYANFDTWESLLSQTITNYHIYDIGAFWEIIADGDPMQAPTGPARGVAVLDSRFCWPTGDPMYPVIYFDQKGNRHILHRSRVIQFVDMTEKNDRLPGWGQCALTRCITAINREILLEQYERASLDDMPAPGFALAKNISEEKLYEQARKMKEKRERDDDMFGRLIFLYSLSVQNPTELEFVRFQNEYGGFDPDKISSKNAKYMAAGFGVDLQDFWELTGRGLGTATQSEILDQKSKGRGLGALIKRLERMINDIFPDGVEFKFKYRNEEEDLERAQTAQAWATAIQMLEQYTTPDERRIMATNQIEALKDAVLDNNGNIIRLDDADPKTPEQAITEEVAPGQPAQPDTETPQENFITGEEKDFNRTARRFKTTFNEVTRLLKDNVIGPGAANILILDELRKEGQETYIDGVRRTGLRKVSFDEQAQTTLNQWLIRQRPFVAQFVGDVQSGRYTDKQLESKGLQWVNGSLTAMLHAGMAIQPKIKWRWITNFAKENCVTCLRLHGQIHEFTTYATRGLLPQSANLVCTGLNCGCRLQKTDEPAQGRIRAVRYVRRL